MSVTKRGIVSTSIAWSELASTDIGYSTLASTSIAWSELASTNIGYSTLAISDVNVVAIGGLEYKNFSDNCSVESFSTLAAVKSINPLHNHARISDVQSFTFTKVVQEGAVAIGLSCLSPTKMPKEYASVGATAILLPVKVSLDTTSATEDVEFEVSLEFTDGVAADDTIGLNANNQEYINNVGFPTDETLFELSKVESDSVSIDSNVQLVARADSYRFLDSYAINGVSLG